MRAKSRRVQTKFFQTCWLATRWFLVFGTVVVLFLLLSNLFVGNQMAAEDAQYLADEGVTHLLNTASGDNQRDGVKSTYISEFVSTAV